MSIYYVFDYRKRSRIIKKYEPCTEKAKEKAFRDLTC